MSARPWSIERPETPPPIGHPKNEGELETPEQLLPEQIEILKRWPEIGVNYPGLLLTPEGINHIQRTMDLTAEQEELLGDLESVLLKKRRDGTLRNMSSPSKEIN